MKHFLLITAFILTPFLAFNQSEIWVLDSFYHYKDITEGVFLRDYYKYDNQGRIVEKTTLLKSNSLKNQRRTFQYFDVENIEVEGIYQQAQNNNLWVFECEIEKEYNYFGNVIREEQSNCPGYYIFGLGNWNKKTHQYDKSDRLIETIEDDDYKRFWTYDEQGNLLERGVSSWDASINDWSPPRFYLKKINGENGKISYYRQANMMFDMFEIQEYFYDSLDRETERLFSLEWLGNQTPQRTRKEVSYYIGNTSRLDYILHQGWSNGSWQTPYFKELYSYDNFGNISEKIIQRIDTNGVLINHNRSSYVYNADNLLEESLWQRWNNDNQGGNWIIVSRHTYLYNADKLLEEFLVQGWDNDNQEWIDGDSEIYTYYPNKALKRETITRNGETSEKIYYRSQKSVSEPRNDIATCLFPNPYVHQQQVYCEALEAEKEYNFAVFNLSGQVVYQTNFIGQDSFQVRQQLEEGWYVFVVLDNGEIVQKQKIWVY